MSLLRHKIPQWAALSVSMSITGCANRGNPRPPSLHLPAAAADLKAERIGDQVLVTWTTSDRTSDGLMLHAPITAVLCRQDAVRTPSRPGPCIPVSRFAATPGPSQAADSLPTALRADPPSLLTYRVELLNPKGRSAGLSAPAFASSGATPPDPGAIHISATSRGAVIQWTPARSDAEMELTRTQVENVPGGTAFETSAAKKTGPGQSSGKFSSPGEPVLLHDPKPGPTDPGGLLDPGVVPHQRYVYTAQRVRTVRLEGHVYRLRSAASSAFSFDYRDVFPPPAPSGLESIAAAPISGSGSIDLSWDASGENDILGYNVYRADSASAAFVRINPAPVPSPAFRDLTARPGQAYRYRVTALDLSGNEGAPSLEIRDSLPTQP